MIEYGTDRPLLSDVPEKPPGTNPLSDLLIIQAGVTAPGYELALDRLDEYVQWHRANFEAECRRSRGPLYAIGDRVVFSYGMRWREMRVGEILDITFRQGKWIYRMSYLGQDHKPVTGSYEEARIYHKAGEGSVEDVERMVITKVPPKKGGKQVARDRGEVAKEFFDFLEDQKDTQEEEVEIGEE